MSRRSSRRLARILGGLAVLSMVLAGCRSESGTRDGSADPGPSEEAPNVSVPSAGSPGGIAVGPGAEEPSAASAEDPFRNFDVRQPGGSLEAALLLPLRIENGTGMSIAEPIPSTKGKAFETVMCRATAGPSQSHRSNVTQRSNGPIITAVDNSTATERVGDCTVTSKVHTSDTSHKLAALQLTIVVPS